MAYVGTPLDTTNAFQSLAGKRFSGDASTTDFTLDSSPNSTLDIEVFVENVRQDPNSAYTVSGTTLAFTAAPPSGTNNIYVVHQAKSVGTIDVPSASVQSGSLNSAFFTGATDIGAAIADADLFLTDDGAGGTIRKTAASRLKTYCQTWVQTGRVNNSSVGATTINLEGCFSTTYDVYMMVMRNFRPATDGSRLRLIILTGTNTLVTGSHYRTALSIDYASGTNSGGVNVERHTGSDEFHFFNSVADGEAHGGGCATLFITVDKSNTSGNTFKYHGTCSFADSNDYQNTGKMGGFYKETTNDENPTGLQFKSDNNITSIDVTMYGLVQS